MIKFIRQVIGLACLEIQWLRRQPLWIIQGIISAIGFILVLVAWGGVSALRRLIVAYIIVGSWGLGLNIIAQDIGWSRIGREYERLVASPLSLHAYFLGVTLGTSPFLLTDFLPAILLAIYLKLNFVTIIGLILLAPLALVLGAFLSLSIILRLKNPTNISAITNPLYTITTILPPVYYPASILPPLIKEIALIVPTASLVEIGRHLLNGVIFDNSLMYPIAVVIFWLILTTVLVAKKLRWGLE